MKCCLEYRLITKLRISMSCWKWLETNNTTCIMIILRSVIRVDSCWWLCWILILNRGHGNRFIGLSKILLKNSRLNSHMISVFSIVLITIIRSVFYRLIGIFTFINRKELESSRSPFFHWTLWFGNRNKNTKLVNKMLMMISTSKW